MRSANIIVFGLSVSLLAMQSFAESVSGSVRMADGKSIVSTVSILYSSNGVSLEAHDTAEDGTFSIEIRSGAVAAAAKAANYSSDEVDLAGGIPSEINFTLRPLTFYRGTVKDSEGQGVEGASIRVRNLDATRRIYVDSHFLDVTDASGEFTVAIPEGSTDRFVADIEAEGWVPQSSTVLGSGSMGNTGVGEASFRSVLVTLESRGATVSGRVESPGGFPLGGMTVLAAVRIQHANVDGGGFSGLVSGPGEALVRPFGRVYRIRTSTDSQGRYEIRGLPPGSLGVVAIKRGVVMQPRRFQSAEGQNFEADFVVPE